MSQPPRILSVVGTRPNFVKMAPVIAELRRRFPEARHTLVHTGQHYDAELSGIFLSELAIPEPDYMLNAGSGTHARQTARVMEAIEPVLEKEQPDLVLVPGDVNSTLAAALVAAKLGIPLAHVESGLRSFDRTMPEEINRVVADQLSDLLFVHSEDAVQHLAREGIAAGRVHLVGNTMIDTLVLLEDRFRALGAPQRFGVREGEFLLVTLHRPALVDGPLIHEVMARLAHLASRLPVVLPLHPRTRNAVSEFSAPAGLHLVDPLGYLDFLSLEASAKAVLTDSGGVQEETTYLGVPCFTLRDNTERPITLTSGTNTLLGLDPLRIDDIPVLLERPVGRHEPPPLWDGRASERLVEIVVEEVLGGG